MKKIKDYKKRVNKILIDYDFDKSTPGTFDFIEAEKKIIKLIDSLLKNQTDENRRKYDNLVHTYYKFQSFLKDALLDWQKLEWQNATGDMHAAKKKYEQMWNDIQEIIKSPDSKGIKK